MTYYPCGCESGSLFAYVYDGKSIRDATLCRDVDFWSLKRKHSPYAVYYKQLTPVGANGYSKGITIIPSRELAKKYGQHIEKETYQEAAEHAFGGISTH